jgi:hypothetical protein
VLRRRIEMVERNVSGAAQPYHAAVGLELAEARRLVTAAVTSAASLAESALRGIVAELKCLGHETAGCGLLLASGQPLPALERILASHALIHTAEGELFREALRAAGARCGLSVASLKERNLFTLAAAALHLPASGLQQHVAQMGRALGPPWRQDEKYSALAAWIALAECQA